MKIDVIFHVDTLLSVTDSDMFILQLVDVFLVLALICCSSWTVWSSSSCKPINIKEVRPHSVSITEFGAVGDGITLNTKAFQNAIFYLNSYADKGGAKLFVPAGQWLTGSFDLISHLTLWLDKDAVILGSTVRHSLLPLFVFNAVLWKVTFSIPVLFL
jgi:hypothetical protein